MRYPLVAGQGISARSTATPPAAMRYTEARPKAGPSDDVGIVTRDRRLVPNYDETTKKPTVLPPPSRTAGQRILGIAVGHGHEHSAATTCAGHRRRHCRDRAPGGGAEGRGDKVELFRTVMRTIPGLIFPRAGSSSGVRASSMLQDRARLDHHQLARQDRGEQEGGQASPSSFTRSPISEQSAPAREDRRVGAREDHRGDHDLRDESDRDGMRT